MDPIKLSDRRDQMQTASSALLTTAPLPLANDTWIYRFAIMILGALALLALGGALVLTALGREAPQVTVALGSAAVGALAGLLTPTAARG